MLKQSQNGWKNNMTIQNRSTMYCVMRKVREPDSTQDVVPIGAWTYAETAYDKKDAFNQQMKDRGFDEFQFEVVALTVYDE